MTAHTPPAPGGTALLAGREVSRIGYGAMQLTPPGAPAVDPGTARTVLRRALELGVTHIDTAQFYRAGRVNEFIRDALHPYPAELALVSKVGAESGPDGLVAAQRPEQLRAGVEENLRALDVDQLAVVNLRRLDRGPGIIADGDQVIDLDAQLAELVALRDEGKIGGIGLSSVSADQVQAALPAGIACVQNYYNLLDRGGDLLLDLCREHGIAWVPYLPLRRADASAPPLTALPAVHEVADRIVASPVQVLLAWLLAHAPNVLLIAGTGSLAHLEENLAAGDLHLDAAAIAVLDAAG